MANDKKEKLESNLSYVRVVNHFVERRKKKKVKQRAIDVMANTGHGKVHEFESFKSSPTLYTFVKWCDRLKVDIYLKHGKQAVRLKAKKALEAERLRRESPDFILDQIKSQQAKKIK